ncbi:MAG TPA: hypothetical protein VNO30_00740 [Kofleriaceae bacterium]|nr:hypothetical protein [Kofleriaceae bacterium]
MSSNEQPASISVKIKVFALMPESLPRRLDTANARRRSGSDDDADQGLPVSKLSALLGHADAATTAIYVRREAHHAAKDPRARLSGNKMATPPDEPNSLPN